MKTGRYRVKADRVGGLVNSLADVGFDFRKLRRQLGGHHRRFDEAKPLQLSIGHGKREGSGQICGLSHFLRRTLQERLKTSMIQVESPESVWMNFGA